MAHITLLVLLGLAHAELVSVGAEGTFQSTVESLIESGGGLPAYELTHLKDDETARIRAAVAEAVRSAASNAAAVQSGLGGKVGAAAGAVQGAIAGAKAGALAGAEEGRQAGAGIDEEKTAMDEKKKERALAHEHSIERRNEKSQHYAKLEQQLRDAHTLAEEKKRKKNEEHLLKLNTDREMREAANTEHYEREQARQLAADEKMRTHEAEEAERMEIADKRRLERGELVHPSASLDDKVITDGESERLEQKSSEEKAAHEEITQAKHEAQATGEEARKAAEEHSKAEVAAKIATQKADAAQATLEKARAAANEAARRVEHLEGDFPQPTVVHQKIIPPSEDTAITVPVPQDQAEVAEEETPVADAIASATQQETNAIASASAADAIASASANEAKIGTAAADTHSDEPSGLLERVKRGLPFRESEVHSYLMQLRAEDSK